MTDALERAARAIADKWLEKVDDSTVRVGPSVIARAALLAFLSASDEAMVEKVRAGITKAIWPDNFTAEACARAAIAALREMLEGEK